MVASTSSQATPRLPASGTASSTAQNAKSTTKYDARPRAAGDERAAAPRGRQARPARSRGRRPRSRRGAAPPAASTTSQLLTVGRGRIDQRDAATARATRGVRRRRRARGRVASCRRRRGAGRAPRPAAGRRPRRRRGVRGSVTQAPQGGGVAGAELGEDPLVEGCRRRARRAEVDRDAELDRATRCRAAKRRERERRSRRARCPGSERGSRGGSRQSRRRTRQRQHGSLGASRVSPISGSSAECEPKPEREAGRSNGGVAGAGQAEARGCGRPTAPSSAASAAARTPSAARRPPGRPLPVASRGATAASTSACSGDERDSDRSASDDYARPAPARPAAIERAAHAAPQAALRWPNSAMPRRNAHQSRHDQDPHLRDHRLDKRPARSRSR